MWMLRQIRKKKRKKIFRFEECWAKDSRCDEVVKRRWTNGHVSCYDKLAAQKSLDLEFDDFTTGNTKKEILRIEKILKDESMW